MTYDYLIVGAGLYGATFAQQAAAAGKTALVIDRRAHIAGNAYTEAVAGIAVHRYGAHIFHTDDDAVWQYVNRFARFNRFTNAPLANFHGQLFHLPFNMNTFHALWGVTTPAAAQAKIDAQRQTMAGRTPTNLEEQAIALVGTDLYRTLVKEYSEKQWGRDCRALPAFIIRRLPLRMTYDNNYFNDRHQGIPEAGYTALVAAMLADARITVKLNCDFLADRAALTALAKQVIYTGPIDAFFDYQLGALEYRALRFETTVVDAPNVQGNAVINYTSHEVPYTRVIEHKHFTGVITPQSVLTREYPEAWTRGKEPFYPVNDAANTARLAQYQALALALPHVHFGGRLGTYRYYNMDQVIRTALDDWAAQV
ncbi:UDP-galactopyranose mutase [Lacticaseibacillus daqingensis]|uniref:UDP-galactopyranose mutase n=1 Tax=Lacticaseibacillus daqingensis TaxID=2486014 RepID=UPI000F7AA096|nr:UDP-galactopyranose mutase [Lacticaseibacillus daqingensis]